MILPTFSSVETGSIISKIVRFVINFETGSKPMQVMHVYEVQLATYPGIDNEIIYLRRL